MARALILDMDDTLYDERSYVLSGFNAVAQAVADRVLTVGASALFDAMVAELNAHGRGKVFDRALEAAGVAPDPQLIVDLVETYRDHRPDIALWPGVADALADLSHDHRLAVVTDGLGQMQRRKVEALGLNGLVCEVFYCWEHQAPKPDPACYIAALRKLDAGPGEAVVVGDNPGHDMAAARAIGARSIRVLTGRFAGLDGDDHRADETVASFLDVPKVLRDRNFGAAA